MGNLTNGIKKFMQNKNTVTVLGVILAIVVLYFAYTMRINSAIHPIIVPYATAQISSGTQITESMVSTREVPPAMVDREVIVNKGEIIDKYSAADTIIPKGSLFYKRAVVEKEQLPANIILDYPKGYSLYNMPVTMFETYGNNVYPGNYIDITLIAKNRLSEDQVSKISTEEDMLKAEQTLTEKILKNVKVLSVTDSAGQAVFQNMDEKRTPAMIVFAVPQEIWDLLVKASQMTTYNVNFKITPTNESLKDEPGDVEWVSDYAKEWINRRATWTGN